MRSQRILVAGAVGATVLASGGAAAFLVLGPGGGDGARPVASATAQRDATAITEVLRRHGATECDDDAERVECRFQGRYVAGTVLASDLGMTAEETAQSWRTGVAQSALGDTGPFAVLTGPNWLVTGPGELVDGVRRDLGGDLVHCDRPMGSCA
ncbi:hypothetical protein [Actinomadura flavalba]|uniref:hypothetical protein n=1 Tax=Actinomadura flavalba TaxID=1120938 RepID=UPI000683EEB8|nr:hypothetical protein [Actinomadura flavalba]